MTTHSNFLTWRIPQTEEPGGLPSDTTASDITERLTHTHTHHTHTHTHTHSEEYTGRSGQEES